MSASSPAITTNRKPPGIWFQVGLAILSPIIFLVILEGIAAWWEHSQAKGPYAWEMVASRRIELIPASDGTAGYTLMKPGSHYMWQSIPVEINANGLRNPDVPYQKPANTYRILNLGDSVVMGWGVKFEDTSGQQLEQQLNQASGGDLDYEVINAGVPGWNLENALAYLQAEGLKYDPDLILLDITLVNDIYGKNALQANKQSPMIDWLRSNTYFWPFLSIQSQWLSARLQGKDRIEVIDPPNNPASYFPLEPGADAWTKLWNSVMQINQVAQSNGVPLALVLYPIEYQVLDSGFSQLPQEILTAKGAEVQLPIVDLLPAFRDACQQKPEGPCTLQDHYLFADVWMHPSTLGNSLAVEQIRNRVELAVNE